MTNRECGATEQNGQEGIWQDRGPGECGATQGTTAGRGAVPSGQRHEQLGAGQPGERAGPTGGFAPSEQGHAAQGAASGPSQPGANQYTGYAAPPPGYVYGNQAAAMGYAPGTAGPPPPYYSPAHQAPYPGAGYQAPPAGMHPQYAPADAYSGGQPQTGGMYPGQGGHNAAPGMHAGMSHFVEEIANGGNGLSSMGKMLNLDDSEFWKGALIGAAAVLLLTNESVQSMLFKTGARAKEAVQSGIDKAKETASEVTEQAKE